jgi:hypothetical protein
MDRFSIMTKLLPFPRIALQVAKTVLSRYRSRRNLSEELQPPLRKPDGACQSWRSPKLQLGTAPKRLLRFACGGNPHIGVTILKSQKAIGTCQR